MLPEPRLIPLIKWWKPTWDWFSNIFDNCRNWEPHFTWRLMMWNMKHSAKGRSWIQNSSSIESRLMKKKYTHSQKVVEQTKSEMYSKWSEFFYQHRRKLVIRPCVECPSQFSPLKLRNPIFHIYMVICLFLRLLTSFVNYLSETPRSHILLNGTFGFGGQ
jgi:hypothetical protein